jgi:hypothetical protein
VCAVLRDLNAILAVMDSVAIPVLLCWAVKI